MRTTRRFSPEVLERFLREERGSGTFTNYIPWHRVGRGDPASRGRSHLVLWRERQRELLSDLEWVVLMFVTMLPRVVDIREQFPLSLSGRRHELLDYVAKVPLGEFPGTLAIAEAARIKHPLVRGKSTVAPWVMTTDLLVTLRSPTGSPFLLAVACKYDNEAARKRTLQLLSLERQYWLSRGVNWLLISPSLFDERVALTLRQGCPWSFGPRASEEQLKIATETVRASPGISLASAIKTLSTALGGVEVAQLAYWQAVWSARIPIDLRRGWRPHRPLELVTSATFSDLNPVASRRSSWT